MAQTLAHGHSIWPWPHAFPMGNSILPMGNQFSDEFFQGFIFNLENQKQLFYKALNKY